METFTYPSGTIQTIAFEAIYSDAISKMVNEFMLKLSKLNNKIDPTSSCMMFRHEYIDMKFTGGDGNVSAFIILRANFDPNRIDEILEKVGEK